MKNGEKLPKFWQVVDQKKFFFQTWHIIYNLERKFNFQYNGENFKCIAYPEQKLFKF